MTGPVRSAYFMLSSTELQTDFDGLTGAGFLSQWNYKLCVVLKSSLIDSEARWGNEAQAEQYALAA
jgi:hypothetical protein